MNKILLFLNKLEFYPLIGIITVFLLYDIYSNRKIENLIINIIGFIALFYFAKFTNPKSIIFIFQINLGIVLLKRLFLNELDLNSMMNLYFITFCCFLMTLNLPRQILIFNYSFDVINCLYLIVCFCFFLFITYRHEIDYMDFISLFGFIHLTIIHDISLHFIVFINFIIALIFILEKNLSIFFKKIYLLNIFLLLYYFFNKKLINSFNFYVIVSICLLYLSKIVFFICEKFYNKTKYLYLLFILSSYNVYSFFLFKDKPIILQLIFAIILIIFSYKLYFKLNLFNKGNILQCILFIKKIWKIFYLISLYFISNIIYTFLLIKRKIKNEIKTTTTINKYFFNGLSNNLTTFVIIATIIMVLLYLYQ